MQVQASPTLFFGIGAVKIRLKLVTSNRSFSSYRYGSAIPDVIEPMHHQAFTRALSD